MLDQITPLILTYNEEPNIPRTLYSLNWAERVVVLDSGSSDQTEAICRSFPNVEWRVRTFDSHRNQWSYGVYNTDINTKFVLALDADMVVPPAFAEELTSCFLPRDFAGGWVPFKYSVLGRKLPGSIYPTQLRLFKPSLVQITQKGHTQEFSSSGELYRFKSHLIHDDRKSLERWVTSQVIYSALEAKHIESGETSRIWNRLRLAGLTPMIAPVLAYLRAGGPFSGRAAVRYAYERTLYECLLVIRLLSKNIENNNEASITGERDCASSTPNVSSQRGSETIRTEEVVHD